MSPPGAPELFDVLIVGAGLSGIGTAAHLKQRFPRRRLAILEGRHSIGGTWDLFRYPGVRSDSDMHTLGYRFKPWTGSKAIADGSSIRAYIEETAHEQEVVPHIRFGHRLVTADWSTEEGLWRLTADHAGERRTFQARFLVMATGYYSYAEAHRPDWPGEASFRGTIVHPQFWPGEMEVAGKRVVVIGSGATAVTLVPALAERGAQVVMLQRSPSYIVSQPSVDRLGQWFRRRLPERTAYRLTRIKNVLLTSLFYRLSRARPQPIARRLIQMVEKELGPNFDPAHFTPNYKPWDQRLCLVPDSDLFRCLSDATAEIVTDQIERFTQDGLRLKSGRDLPADIVVTATGLKISLFGGAQFSIDGTPIRFADRLAYKGMMFDGVPNMAFIFGYTNASWTLKADLTSEYLGRLLAAMDRRGVQVATPIRGPQVEEAPFLDFTSGYVQRAAHLLPKQGTRAPWRLKQNYFHDLFTLRFGKVDDGTMRFQKAPARLCGAPAGAILLAGAPSDAKPSAA